MHISIIFYSIRITFLLYSSEIYGMNKFRTANEVALIFLPPHKDIMPTTLLLQIKHGVWMAWNVM
jgi:hypothetical protein